MIRVDVQVVSTIDQAVKNPELYSLLINKDIKDRENNKDTVIDRFNIFRGKLIPPMWIQYKIDLQPTWVVWRVNGSM